MNDAELYIMANYPVLYMVTPEEQRVVDMFKTVCNGLERHLWIYSISEGLKKTSYSQKNGLWYDGKEHQAGDPLRDPISMLEYIKNIGPRAGIFLLLDFHDPLKDAMVQRLVKDMAHRFKKSHNTLVIVSPVMQIPRSLIHDIHVLDFPFPAKTVLLQHLEDIIPALKKRKIAVDLTVGDKERIATAGQGLTVAEFENCLARGVVKLKRLCHHIIEEIVFEKKQQIRKSGLLEFFDTHETMEQIGGLTELKSWLSKRQLAFTDKAKAYGIPSPKGILLIGVQGCGKSLTAKACAALWRFPMLRLDTGRLFESQVGSSEHNIRRAISIAQALAPCILWIDEIEKSMSGTGSSSQSDAGTAARVFATLATWLQEKTAQVFVIATANDVTALPPELLRKGRWDELFFVDLPGLAERESIIAIHLKKRHRNPADFDVGLLARNCPGHSGAEIEQAIVDGLYEAFDKNRPLITFDILKALKSQIPLWETMNEQIEALRAWACLRARKTTSSGIEEELEALRRK